MLIATAVAVALAVNVSVAPGISASLVSRVLTETNDIWRYSGVTFAWQPAGGAVSAGTLHVVIGHDAHPTRDGGFALGWIVFEDSKPEQTIYVSYANAYHMMVESPGVVGVVSRMPVLEKETLLARAMGRALAHEIAHYLLGSKVHTPSGLMRARVTAAEFFGPDRRSFMLDNQERDLITARLARESVIVSR